MNILINGTAILGLNPVDTGLAYQLVDITIPKHTAPSAAIVSVASMPADWAPGRYTWVNGAVQAVTPPAAPKVVPASVTMAQARLALLDAGLLSSVETAMQAMPQAAQVEWEYRATVERQSPLVAGMMVALSLTSAEVDDLFIAAAAK